MKKILLAVSGILTVAVIVGGIAFKKNNLTFSTGRYVASSNGSHIVIINNSPIVMSNHTGSQDVFLKLQTGDEIFIVNGLILTTYPGQTGVYFCMHLNDGTESDISADILNRLREMGWY